MTGIRTARHRFTGEPGKDFKIIDTEGEIVGESDALDKALRSAEHANVRIRQKENG